jgi:hypothetical protein
VCGLLFYRAGLRSRLARTRRIVRYSAPCSGCAALRSRLRPGRLCRVHLGVVVAPRVRTTGHRPRPLTRAFSEGTSPRRKRRGGIASASPVSRHLSRSTQDTSAHHVMLHWGCSALPACARSWLGHPDDRRALLAPSSSPSPRLRTGMQRTGKALRCRRACGAGSPPTQAAK